MDSTDSEGNEVLPEKIKVPKHVIEKKRRARINSCLGELKKLVIEKDCLKGQRSSKLEKADILELTVDFLKRKAKLPYPALESSDVRDLQTKLYARGYRECLDQVSKYLKSAGIAQPVGDTLLSELETVAEKLISKNAKLSDKHLRSMSADGTSHNGLPTLSRSECSDHAINSVNSDGEVHLGTAHIPKERLAAETIHHNFRILPNGKQYLDHKWKMTPSTSRSSIGVIKDKPESPSTSITTAREQSYVHSLSPPSIYPMIGSLQNVTVFVPCQVLASAIPPISTNHCPSFSNVCEHAGEIRPPIFNQPVDFHDVSTNPSFVNTDTFIQNNFNVASESATVSNDLKEGKDTCPNNSVSPMQPPWRPW